MQANVNKNNVLKHEKEKDNFLRYKLHLKSQFNSFRNSQIPQPEVYNVAEVVKTVCCLLQCFSAGGGGQN